MALTIGELVGFIDLDNKGFEQGLDDSESSFERFSGRLATAAAAGAAIAGAALASGFADALEFEKADSKLSAQLDLTEAESERVGGVSGRLFADAYGQSIGEVNTALRGIIAQTGDLGDLTDDELSKMGAAALDYANAFDVDVSRAIQVAGQAVKQGLAGDMTEAFDLITAASQKTMPGLEQDVLDAADEYGRFFQQLGMSGPEAFGMLAAASEGGTYQIDKTGDALKEFTARAADMSAGSVAAFEAIGMDAEEMAGKILAGGDTSRQAFDQIIDGLLAIEDPVAQQTAALGLFGSPLEDLSTAQIPDFLSALDSSTTSLGDVGGAAEDMGDTLNDNAATGLTAAGRAAKDSLMSAVEPLIPILIKFLDFIEPIAPLLGVLAVALGIAAAATWILNAALWANPIVWIIAAVIALVAAIWLLVENWDTVSAAIILSWELTKEKASEIWGAISDFFVMIGTSIKDFFVGLWNGIKDFFVGIWNAIVDHVRSQVNAFLAVIGWFAELPGKIAGWFQSVKDSAVNKLTSLVDWVKGLPDRITSAIGDLKELLTSKGKNIIDGLLNGMKNTAGAIKDWIWGLLEDIAGSVKDFFGISSPSKLMRGFGENIGEGLALGIRDSVSGVDVASTVLAEAAMPATGGMLGGNLASGRGETIARLDETDRELLRELASSRNRVDVSVARGLRAESIRENAMVVG